MKTQTVKRGPGRPRKNPIAGPTLKMSRGRPQTHFPITQDLRASVLSALPEMMMCPHCHLPRTRDEFGVRTVESDRFGNPVKVIRQSWCQSCRAGYGGQAAAKMDRPPKESARTYTGKKLFAGLESSTHVYAFESKRELKQWLQESPGHRQPIEDIHS